MTDETKQSRQPFVICLAVMILMSPVVYVLSSAPVLAVDRNAPKHDLIKLGVAICEAKLFVQDAQKKYGQIVEDLSITDEYGDNVNRIHVYCRAKSTKELKELRGLVIERLGRPLTEADFARAGLPISYNSNYSRDGCRHRRDGIRAK